MRPSGAIKQQLNLTGLKHVQDDCKIPAMVKTQGTPTVKVSGLEASDPFLGSWGPDHGGFGDVTALSPRRGASLIMLLLLQTKSGENRRVTFLSGFWVEGPVHDKVGEGNRMGVSFFPLLFCKKPTLLLKHELMRTHKGSCKRRRRQVWNAETQTKRKLQRD